MVLLQLTANTGPAECCLAVKHALGALMREAAKAGVKVEVLEEEAGAAAGTCSSLLLGLSVEGAGAAARASHAGRTGQCAPHVCRQAFYRGGLIACAAARQVCVKWRADGAVLRA